MWGLLTTEGVLNTGLRYFYGPWDQRADEGSPRNGKVLGTESEWGKVLSRFPPYSPDKKVSAEIPEDDLCSRSQLRRLRKEDIRNRNANI